MAATITPEIESKLEKAVVIWFTTVRADGMPQPTPVWFVWQDGSFILYSKPTAQKVHNLEANSKVAVNLDDTHDGDTYTVFMGEARIDRTIPAPSQLPAYIEKYRQGIRDINMTPESFDHDFSVPIRVTPMQVREE
jgi:PPOX class probable F420-dependent enzyme